MFQNNNSTTILDQSKGQLLKANSPHLHKRQNQLTMLSLSLKDLQGLLGNQKLFLRSQITTRKTKNVQKGECVQFIS